MVVAAWLQPCYIIYSDKTIRSLREWNEMLQNKAVQRLASIQSMVIPLWSPLGLKESFIRGMQLELELKWKYKQSDEILLNSMETLEPK